MGGATSNAFAPTSPRACTSERATRVENVADDRHREPLETAERLAQRVEVEQRLRRVLVFPVTGVDDVCTRVPRDERRRTDRRMAHDDDVRIVGGKRQAVSLSDSPLSTEEPAERTDIVSAESRFAASSKLESVRVDDS